MIEKKIGISAQDNGFANTFKKMQKDAEDFAKNLLNASKQTGEANKEQTRELEKQIKLLEKKAALEDQARRKAAQISRDMYQSTGDAGHAAHGNAQFRRETADANMRNTGNQEVIRQLKATVEAIKSGTKEEVKTEEKVSQKAESKGGFFNFMFGKLGQFGEYDEYKKSETDKPVPPSSSTLVNGPASGGGDDDGGSGGGGRSGRGRGRGGRGGRGRNAFNDGADAATRDNEIIGAAALLAIIPFVGMGMSKIASKFLEEGSALESGRKGALGTTGFDIAERDPSNLGFNKAAYYGFATQLAKARGSAGMTAEDQRVFGGSLPNETEALLATSKAYNIDESQILNIAATQRFDRNQRGSFGDIQNLIEIMRPSGAFGSSGQDMSRLAELLELQNNMILEQTAVLETTNSDTNANILARFQSVGGSFGDSRAGQRISTIHQGLQNPQGDFKQAFAYSILRDLDPDASFFKLKQMQSGGITTNNYLHKTMGAISKRTNNTDSRKLMLQEFFGLEPDQVDALYSQWEQNPNIFENMTSDKRQELGLSEAGIKSKGASRTGIMARRTAQVDNLYAGGGEKALQFLDKHIGTMDTIFTKFDTGMESFMDDMKKGASEVWKTIQADWTSVFNFITNDLSGAAHKRIMSERKTPSDSKGK